MKRTISSFEEDNVKNILNVILAKEPFINLTSNSALKTAFKTKKNLKFLAERETRILGVVLACFTISNAFCVNISVQKHIFSLIIHNNKKKI